MKRIAVFDGRAALDFYFASEADALPGGYASHVAPHEKNRAEKMQSLERAETFLKSRALLRLFLGDRLDLEPQKVPIELTPEGKPFLTGFPLAFSLSHAHGMILIGWMKSEKSACHGEAAQQRSLGVDLEYMDSSRDIEKLAARVRSSEPFQSPKPQAPSSQSAWLDWCRYEARKKCGAPGPGENIREASGFFEGGFAWAVAASC